ncbi:MAG TPA: DUF4114 domain-containing protein [Archangium sp.]|uniref:DUF4114 domain-containing protein n=1 Tax=Archangium sp. TaxID=1872627 RepID=UPI002E30113C|nr:DUF4114 domain-containing protein [Archangium sp.]HEX5752974.1 DUF4114 domain-containing protein [Archangium sp.]
MHKSLKNRLMAGTLAVAGLQGLGCGGALGDPPRTSPELSQVQQALAPTGVTAAPNDTYSQQLKDDIAAALKESQSVPLKHPELLPPNLVPDLQVAQDLCKVWVSFYSEGAGYKNTLGYFTYPNGQPPLSVPLSTRQSNVIFANASAQGSGGTLVQGNRYLLGSGTNTTFSAGSRIGFYLVADGWNGTAVDFSRPTYYTVDALNPESTAAKRRHALIVRHADSQRLVMGYEDLNRGGSSDDDFNDVVFVINWEPAGCLIIQNPDIDPDASCQAVKTRNPAASSGYYFLDPCGTQGAQKNTFYCDMDKTGANGIKGGWTVPGWQHASATTNLGVSNWGTPSDTGSWSRRLQCLPFNETMVFNKTSGEYFTETLNGSQFQVTSTPYALGEPGRSFNQGSYGPSNSNITQACVGYNYDGSLFAEWACVTDWTVGGTARGHIADYAIEYNCNPSPAYEDPNYDWNRPWAWANNTTCTHVGEDYLWGIGVR